MMTILRIALFLNDFVCSRASEKVCLGTVKRPEAGALRVGNFGGVGLVGLSFAGVPLMGAGLRGGTKGGRKFLDPEAPRAVLEEHLAIQLNPFARTDQLRP
jgi:hypothetical protein